MRDEGEGAEPAREARAAAVRPAGAGRAAAGDSGDPVERAVLLAPPGPEADRLLGVLVGAGLSARLSSTVSGLPAALDGGAALLVAEAEMLEAGGDSALADWLARRKSASDLQVVALTPPGATAAAARLDAIALERPVRADALAGVARAAARGAAQARRLRAEAGAAALEAGGARTRLGEIEAVYAEARVGLCVIDRDLRFVRINHRLAAMNGLAAEAHVGRTVREVVPALADAADAIAARVFATGEAVTDVELRGETPAEPGVERVWLEQWTPLRDAEGAVIGVNVSVEEVTERRKAAERQAALLRLTQSLLEEEGDEAAIAARVHDWIAPTVGADMTINYRVELDGGLALVRAAGAPDAFLAVAQRLAPGEALCGAVAASARPLAADAAALAVDPRAALVRAVGGRAYACQPLAARDGRTLGTLSFCSTRRAAFDADALDYLQTVANTVAQAWDRLAAARALASAERRTRLVLDGAVAFIGLLTPEGVLLEANAAALAAGGLTREDVVGRPFWECFWWSYDAGVAARLREAVARARAGETVRHDAVVRMAGDARMTIDFMLAPIRDERGRVEFLVPSGFDITERERAQARQKVLANELAHRAKNLLQVVQVVVGRSLADARDPAEARAAIEGRLAALARSLDEIRAGGTDAADLARVVAAGCATAPRPLLMEGPSVPLSPQAAQTLGLVVHELATNAMKHGALSVAHGVVTVRWSTEGREGGRRLAFEWRERGGPPASPPARRGFGTTLLTRVAGAEFGCAPALDYDAGGFSYRFEAALDALAPQTPPPA